MTDSEHPDQHGDAPRHQPGDPPPTQSVHRYALLAPIGDDAYQFALMTRGQSDDTIPGATGHSHHLTQAAVGHTPTTASNLSEIRTVPRTALGKLVQKTESQPQPPRWVWADSATTYAEILHAGARVARCHDLRLTHRILRTALWAADTPIAKADPGPWDEPTPPAPDHAGLFAASEATGTDTARPGIDDLARELDAQLDTLAEIDPNARRRLELLIAGESAGALVAAEMTHTGLPWRADLHDQILAGLLGPRPVDGYRPARLEELATRIRDELQVGDVNPDSPGDLLRALRRAGAPIESTRSWDIKKFDHPAADLVLEYKKLSRLWTANGWRWLDSWVRAGRFHPTYVVGGVVTGRWASDGGGALQLPHNIRDAVRADPGWTFVAADAAQLEPRILAAVSGDAAMARAGQSADMYEGIVAAGAVRTRTEAKYGMLGAMYGGTTGVSGQVLPNLRRAFPAAIGLVERAAEVGVRGGQVTTWLGRTSPLPGADWSGMSGEWSPDESDGAAQARSAARSWGRFTRNFVIQGTAAEWALCWLAIIRTRLRDLGVDQATGGRPELVFFLHDEVIVHSPAVLADQVTAIVRQAATEAGRLLFGDIAVEFALTAATVDSYADAK